MALETELVFYRDNIREWSEHEGKFVLIKGKTVYGFFSTFEDAISVGYDKFRLEDFLVKQVETTQRIQFLHRAPLRALAW